MGSSPTPKRRPEKPGSESGFTLIELLVVMLILGILAAIAITTFLNQENKATDSAAKANARTLQTAIEACSTDNDGSYASCDITKLRAVEPAIPQSGSNVTVDSTADSWTVSALSESGNTFTVERDDTGKITRNCSVGPSGDRGGCRAGDTW